MDSLPKKNEFFTSRYGRLFKMKSYDPRGSSYIADYAYFYVETFYQDETLRRCNPQWVAWVEYNLS